MSPGENHYLRLVKKQKKAVPGFFVANLGWVCALKKDNLRPAFIGVPNKWLGPPHIETPLGKLKVKTVSGLQTPTVFYQENVSNSSINNIELDIHESTTYQCKFCNQNLIPVETTAWTIDFVNSPDMSCLQGVIPSKHWKTVAGEISNKQIITRNRERGTGIQTLEINRQIGLKNSILDPEFYIQFLVPYLAMKSTTTIKSFFISEVNQKYIVNSLRLYQLLPKKIVDRVYVVGILMGEDHQTMRKSNKNVVGLQETVERYGLDAVRIFAAKANLLVRLSRVFNNSDLKGAKKFVKNLIWKFEHGSLNDQCNIHEKFKLLSNGLDTKMTRLNFSGTLAAVQDFFKKYSGDIPLNKDEQEDLFKACDY